MGRFSLVPHCIKIILIQCGTRPKTSGTKVGTPPSPEPLVISNIYLSLSYTGPNQSYAIRTTEKFTFLLAAPQGSCIRGDLGLASHLTC